MDKTDKGTSPLYILFFVLSGAELELDVFSNLSVIVVGLVYIFARASSANGWARASAQVHEVFAERAEVVGHYVALPQAGVALGMSVTVAQTLGADGELIRNIVLFGVLIYELIGPAMTRIALIHSGDIQPKNEDVVSADD